MRLTQEFKQLLDTMPVVHLATADRAGRPQVVPVRIRTINDDKLLIMAIRLEKTRKNLEENPQIAIAVEQWERKRVLKQFQIKGRASIFEGGKYFEEALKMASDFREIRPCPDPKAAILVHIEEIVYLDIK